MDKEDFDEIINIEYTAGEKLFLSYMDTYSGLSNTEPEFNLADAVYSIINSEGTLENKRKTIDDLRKYLANEIDKGDDDCDLSFFESLDSLDPVIELLKNIVLAMGDLNKTNNNCGKNLKML